MKAKLILLASTMLFAAACTKVSVDTPAIEEPTSGTKLTATTESATRTALSPFGDGTTYHINWQSGDQIYIKDTDNDKVGFYSTTDHGSTTATFVYEAREGDLYADVVAGEISSGFVFYPTSNCVSLNNSLAPILPAVQRYVAGNVSGFPMYAFIDKSKTDTDVNISFTNMCGIIRLNLSDDAASPQTITDVSMFVSSDNRLNKEYALNGMLGIEDGEPFLTGWVVDESGNLLLNALAYQILLDCGEGVQLSDTATPFHVAVPPATYGAEFRIETTLADGHVCYVLSKNPITVERSKITDITLPLSHFHIKRARLLPGRGTEAIYGFNDGYNSQTSGFNVHAKFLMDRALPVPNTAVNIHNYATPDEYIDKIEVYCKPSHDTPSCVVSTTSSNYIIYAEGTKEEGVLRLYTEGQEILLDPSSGHMFENMTKMASVDMSHFDTSLVTDMRNMFYGCASLTSIDLSKFDTSKVTDMHYMFSHCESLTSIDLSNFDTSKVTDMSYMFDHCPKLNNINLGPNFVVAAEHTDMFKMYISESITSGTIRCSPKAKAVLQSIVPTQNLGGQSITWTWINATTGAMM